MAWIESLALPLAIGLAILLVIAVAYAYHQRQRRLADLSRAKRLNEELFAVSGDASVGRRLPVPDDPDEAVLAKLINRLFDALEERDQKLAGRDRLFRDFSRTLPEIVLIHDEKMLGLAPYRRDAILDILTSVEEP